MSLDGFLIAELLLWGDEPLKVHFGAVACAAALLARRPALSAAMCARLSAAAASSSSAAASASPSASLENGDRPIVLGIVVLVSGCLSICIN